MAEDLKRQMSVHGGEIRGEAVQYDFSVSTGALGCPKSVYDVMVSSLADCERYPEYFNKELKRNLAEKHGISEDKIAIGNGSSELFMAIVHALKPRKIMIPIPSFYGYEYAALAGEGEVCFYPFSEENAFLPGEDFFEKIKEEFDLLFLGNPNNPTGKLLPTDLLFRTLDLCRECKVTVVLDESFYELTGENNSMFHRLEEYPNLICVNSFTKTFSVPGIRIGYLACFDTGLVAEIERHLPEWNVSVIAQAVAMECLKHPEHIQKTVDYTIKEREYLTDRLKELGLKVYPSDTNYLLLFSDSPLYEELLKRKILIRDASGFKGLKKGFCRIAIKSREENELLLANIKEIAEQ